ncbi:hypothetical protein AFCDBAGC_2990 [Methylobacterium cerastii]|uniref:Uncharacterized protein n=1 Tax=Methylobacterium cerastii TaxID=932741 RepID=A0ABQ4QIN4_9HYPH|nr:hypothetical protein AFCDBAGC_2990 [Methylobacterium cerastii]
MTETFDDLKFLMSLAFVVFGGFGLDALLR